MATRDGSCVSCVPCASRLRQRRLRAATLLPTATPDRGAPGAAERRPPPPQVVNVKRMAASLTVVELRAVANLVGFERV
jgi:hypothetical protein